MEVTHCNIIAMAMKSEPSEEGGRGGKEQEFPQVGQRWKRS